MSCSSTCQPGEVELDGMAGTIRLCTDRSRELQVAGDALPLAAFEGVVLERP